MALTRKLLAAMGIDEEKQDQIISAHVESLDGVKAERDRYKTEAEKVATLEAENDKLKKAAASSKPDEIQSKYDALKAEYDKYKADVTAKETAETKSKAYKQLLKDSGVSEKRIDSILKVTSLDDIEIGTDGKIKDAEEKAKAIKTEWADFITTEATKGADTATPPGDSTGDGVTAEQFAKMGYSERIKMYNENRELYDKLTS
jgi:hypothetical protein